MTFDLKLIGTKRHEQNLCKSPYYAKPIDKGQIPIMKR